MFPFRGERYSYQFREHPKPSETEPDRARQKKNDTIKKKCQLYANWFCAHCAKSIWLAELKLFEHILFEHGIYLFVLFCPLVLFVWCRVVFSRSFYLFTVYAATSKKQENKKPILIHSSSWSHKIEVKTTTVDKDYM